MVTGAAISAVFFCMKQRHPTLDEPVIDYDLMLLIQPTLMLGISIGVILSVIFADWMVTILLIILCIVTSIRAFFMGADTWKKETKMKEESQETIKLSESTATCSEEEGYKYLPGCSDEGYEKDTRKPEVSILGNMYWKEFVLIFIVWLAFVVLQIANKFLFLLELAFHSSFF